MSPEILAETGGGLSLRERCAPLVSLVAEKLDDIAPEITPSHLSFTGAALTGLGLVQATRGKTKSAAALLVVGNGIDAFDGASSDVKNRRYPGSWDTDKGLRIDSACDIIKELSMGFAKILHAKQQADEPGTALSSVSTMTSPLSSAIRARADSQGEEVAETGRNLIEFFGTRTGRTVANIAANVSPHSRKTRLVADSLITAGNLSNILRYKSRYRTRPPMDKHQERARFRTRLHASVFVATTAGVLAVNKYRKAK